MIDLHDLYIVLLDQLPKYNLYYYHRSHMAINIRNLTIIIKMESLTGYYKLQFMILTINDIGNNDYKTNICGPDILVISNEGDLAFATIKKIESIINDKIWSMS